jgi:hypothetical protein
VTGSIPARSDCPGFGIVAMVAAGLRLLTWWLPKANLDFSDQAARTPMGTELLTIDGAPSRQIVDTNAS